ncbi:hypothetical protein SAMN06272771_3344 [Streptomyces sp. Ag82_O1-12]|uniref:hypothetical protein n=1 Tax=unclassified Streptomyces TaxID=2593676 RepID=UPI000BD72B03|nr:MULTISPECIES: hypothetical protein [unclassified Streptomyces]SMQ16963.1 hypothetical protein SAMN06272771_3344 [Streptomyces sp. Ag82_O1-12]SOD45992.1 hypothetical protein SAMN06272727_3341 [Streptomyces sp. Ag82_G6-1]
MRARVLATSAALLLSLAAALLVGGGSGIDWPAGGESTVAHVEVGGGDIDWP